MTFICWFRARSTSGMPTLTLEPTSSSWSVSQALLSMRRACRCCCCCVPRAELAEMAVLASGGAGRLSVEGCITGTALLLALHFNGARHAPPAVTGPRHGHGGIGVSVKSALTHISNTCQPIYYIDRKSRGLILLNIYGDLKY